MTSTLTHPHHVRVDHDPGAAPRRPAAVLLRLLLPLLGLGVLATVAALTAAAHDRPRLWSLGSGTDIGNGLGSAVAGLLILVSAAVVLRHPEHSRFGWALAGCGLFWSIDGLTESYISLGLVSPGARPGMTFAVWMLLRFNSFLPLTLVLLALLFPTGRFLPGRWRVASWTSVTVLAASSVLWLVTPYVDEDSARLPPGVHTDPTTLQALGDAGPVLAATVQSLALVTLLVPIGVVVARYRRSSGTLRERMRWLLWGVLATVLVIGVSVLLDLGGASAVLFLLAVVLVPVSMAVAVVNPRLVDIEDLLARTLVYGGLSVLLVLVDLAVLAGMTELAGDTLAEGQVVVLVLLLSVVVYGPLRLRAWAVVRRAVLGSRDDPYDVVAGLASSLEAADEGSAQLAAVARAVAAAFGIGYVRVEVDRGGGERVVATHGSAPAETRTLPIAYRGAEVGRLVLPARGLRSRLSRRDEQLLGDLVRQAATAARTSRLADELQDNRERLVVAREEERRRIRRDLHDGLGPALSGVVFQLESARLLVDTDPETAKTRIESTSRHVQDVVADVRRLVHDLRPPALDDRGLVGALRQLADRLAADGTTVTLEADDLGALPAAVEVAAYRIVGEALTNVARHARASTAIVRLCAADGTLTIEVADDGVGIPADVEAGVGLVSLRERADELGGRSEVTCPDTGGTVVRARLPLRRNP